MLDDAMGEMVRPEIFVGAFDGFMRRHAFVEIVTPPGVGQVIDPHTDLVHR